MQKPEPDEILDAAQEYLEENHPRLAKVISVADNIVVWVREKCGRSEVTEQDVEDYINETEEL